MVYRQAEVEDPNKIFCRIWDAIITDGQAWRLSAPSSFDEGQWREAGFYIGVGLTGWSHNCPWISRARAS